MIKKICNAVSSLFSSVNEIVILLMVLPLTCMAAFIIVCFAFRMIQLLWRLIFRNPWI